MEKRQLPEQRDVTAKRAKPEIPISEKIRPIKLANKTKTKYFFGPINRLTVANASRNEADLSCEDDKPFDGMFSSDADKFNHQNKENEEVEQEIQNHIRRQSHKLKDHQEKSQDSHDSQELQVDIHTQNRRDQPHITIDLQSSDDSFEGIKWRTTPKRNGIRNNMSNNHKQKDRLPSSPLKHSISIQKEEIEPINEQTNSVLSKYGADFHNILSQSPNLQRAHSDIASSNSNSVSTSPFLQSPSLPRSKTTGLDSLVANRSMPSKPVKDVALPETNAPNTATNALNSWIDKFDMSMPNHDCIQTTDTIQEDSLSTPGNFDRIPHSSSPPSPSKQVQKIDNSADEFDVSTDPFSDDDEDLVLAIDAEAAKSNFTMAIESGPMVNENTKPTSNCVGNLIDINTDSDDPFSDDDSELIHAMDAKSGKTLILSDLLKYSRSFQDGVKKFEQMQVSRLKLKMKEELVDISYCRPDLKRYQITSITEGSIKSSCRTKRQLILDVIESGQAKLTIILQDDPSELALEVDDIIHVIITHKDSPRLVDNTHNILIWNPDVLLSSTLVALQLNCPRKSVILNRFSFPGLLSIPLIVGEIIHQIFQECFRTENWDGQFMEEKMNEYLDDYRTTIYSINETVEVVQDTIISQLPYLRTWFDKYYKSKELTSGNVVEAPYDAGNVQFSVDDALDIEEDIWSPTFGLKGKIDVTLKAKLKNKTYEGMYLLPMEIKSGREYTTHHAQTILYSLLIKDRYAVDIKSYLLVYTKNNTTKKCDFNYLDLKSLVNHRNKLSQFFKDGSTIYPELTPGTHCDRCDVKDACLTLNRLVENETAKDSGMSIVEYETATKHLGGNPQYNEFYQYWYNLLVQEELVMNGTVKYLWLHTAKQREQKSGTSLGNLVITAQADSIDRQNHYDYTFVRKQGSSSPSIHYTQLVKFDKILISDESGQFAIARGVVKSISDSAIEITTVKRILTTDVRKGGFNRTNNQVVRGVLHNSSNDSILSEKTFRIDKDEMYYGMGLAKFNVLNLFLPDGDVRRRKLIVDFAPPTFNNTELLSTKINGNFNPDQLNAFETVLKADDYSLILGMPGTGKTTVISELIRFLVANKKTVLLASFTNSAVDNILLKIKDFKVPFLRIGYYPRVHKDIQQFLPDCDDRRILSKEDFVKAYLDPPVVASTCLKIQDPVFSLRDKFDYCIIDEASQVSMPVCLGPLRFCEKFILVGDHFQLPPLVQNLDSDVRKGLSQSLFKMLADAHPSSVVELTYQYRMCKEIMKLCNVLIYENRLKCGSAEVANQTLRIPNPEVLDSYQIGFLSSEQKWLHNVIEENRNVLFLNHDNLPALETVLGDQISNKVEAELVRQVVETLIGCGVQQGNIGVMAFNRGQLRLLKKHLHNRENVEILTADQYQGRDKDCIVISLVRSNTKKITGDLVRDWRRINVAVTRARSKLIILGSKSTLSNADTIQTFMNLLSENGWIYELPPSAHELYSIANTGSSQAQNSSSNIVDSKMLNNHPFIKEMITEMIE